MAMSEENRKKLEAHLKKMKDTGGKRSPEAEKENESVGNFREEPGSDYGQRDRWETWKRMHGNRIHDMKNVQPRTEADHSDYRVLGLKASASKGEVKKAYYQLAKVHHPDAGGNPEKFQEIWVAYNRIMDEFEKASPGEG